MPAELQKEIEKHLATFPERNKELDEMKNEWREFKSKALWIFICSASVLVSYGVWVGTMQTNITQIQKEQGKADVLHEQISERVNNLEVTNGEIRARLSSIDATLLEIKAAIKLIR